MANAEIEIAISLGKCTYLPGSFEKRFAANLAFIARNSPEKEITEKQRVWMYNQLKRYRKQIPQTYEKYCNTLNQEK
jgi:hypothetical protein